MVGNSKVFVAPLARAAAICSIEWTPSLEVECACSRPGCRPRAPTRVGRFRHAYAVYLVVAFAQLWLDIRQPEGAVDAVFTRELLLWSGQMGSFL